MATGTPSHAPILDILRESSGWNLLQSALSPPKPRSSCVLPMIDRKYGQGLLKSQVYKRFIDGLIWPFNGKDY